MRLSIYIAAIMLLAVSACANSLWTPASGGLFADLKAHQVGDVVTVLVVESSASSQKASTDYDKKFDHGNDVGVGTLLKNVPGFDFTSAQKGSASGTTSSTSNFTAKITATVTKVLPNGNLTIEATRSVATNSEKQEIKLTGVVRPQDIAPDNTVLSTYLANAQIQSTGKGPIGDRQKEGIISKLLKFLF
jgi:flagellar L-ring protein precursor FlgH